MFFKRGRTKTSLKLAGKVPSENDKLMILVMGVIRESRQDLRRKVGMISREQVALDDIRIARRTSSWEVGEKVLKDGGLEVDGRLGEEVEFGVREDDSIVILSLKKS